MRNRYFLYLIAFLIVGCDKDKSTSEQLVPLEIQEIKIGDASIISTSIIPNGENIIDITFNSEVSENSDSYFTITDKTLNVPYVFDVEYVSNCVKLNCQTNFAGGSTFEVDMSNQIKGAKGESFNGMTINFSVANDSLRVLSLTYNSNPLSQININTGVVIDPTFTLNLSHDVSVADLIKNTEFKNNSNNDLLVVTIEKVASKIFKIKPTTNLKTFTTYSMSFESDLGVSINKMFGRVEYVLNTSLNTLTDDELLTLVQEQTLKYFWDFGHPVSGLARERNSSGDVVTIGGSGFGLMSMIVGVERGFISRQEAIVRWEIILSFLKNADRFHGAWPHWMNGASGKALPFSAKDNGADLVETAFMVQALITLRQFLNPNDSREADLIDKINFLWEAVEWDWFTRGGQKTLYWHWSPDFEWDMDFRISGHNETLITYVLAASSKSHTIDKDVYTNGYARNGDMKNGNTYYGYKLALGSGRGGPLFFSHYSFIGLDPRNLSDEFANYWEQNTNHTQINRSYCYANPLNKVGYGKGSWGLTACDGNNGYSAFSPDNDKGVIAPTAALSSIPYTPVESMDVIKRLYYDLGDKMWGPYGFYDSYNESADWYATSNLAIDQGPIVCMIENYRTGLLWDLFMSAPEIQTGLTKLGFTY